MTGNILFIDIETIPQYYPYDTLPEDLKNLWEDKMASKPEITPREHYERAGIYSEFAKIFCIGYGYEKNKGTYLTGILKGDEREILTGFSSLLKNLSSRKTIRLCAHNGKEFDVPFLCRRFLANELPIPHALNFQAKKPWEVDFIDTMELWKFGDRKNYTSLDLLAKVFNIPSPKNNMKGSDVCRKVYEEKAYDEVYAYCKKDIMTLIKVYYYLSARFQEVQHLKFEEN
jgi:predicted PolB exonuclease-like 3'-5' exonuclease